MLKRNEITDEELREIEEKREVRQRRISEIESRRKAEEKNKKLKEVELQKTKEKKLIEFSKKIMFFVMSTAFIVIIFSMYIIKSTGDITHLNTLIIEVLNFAKIGVGFYSAKAAVENYQKIKNCKIIDDFKYLQIKEFIDNLENNENIKEEDMI